MNEPLFDTYSTLGKRAMEEGRFKEALGACLKMLEFRPNDPQSLANMAGIYAKMSQHETALKLLSQARDLAPHDPRRHNDYLYFLNHIETPGPETLTEHKKFGELLASQELPFPPRRKKGAGEKIRIGYVSSDLHEHATSFILEPILEHHDHTRFEIYLYSTEPLLDSTTERLRLSADIFREAWNLPPERIRDIILADEIDILIDLGGHTGGNSLPVFALRAAPIQVSWFGYMNTSGLSTMDYRLTDPWRAPRERSQFYTEELIHLSNSYTFKPLNREVSPLPFLSNGYITFGSFNTSWKIQERTVDLWANILKKIPTSRLKFMVPRGTEYSSWILRQFNARGIDNARIETIQTTTLPNFLDQIRKSDIALDTFPYSGGATTYHALSRGVPSVTLEGQGEYARNCSAILREVHLTDWIASSHEQYESLAVQKASSLEELVSLRNSLPEKIGRNAKQLVREVEAQFESILKKRIGI